MSQAFELHNVSYRYPDMNELALANLNLQVGNGEFVLLLGASGSGKSTFLRTLNGLVPRFYGGEIAGQVCLHGQDVSQLTQRQIVTRIGFLHQDPERQLLLDSVERELVFGMENLGIPEAEMKSRMAEMSHLFGLGALWSKRVAELSGGEKQRLALAGVLAAYPQVLLLDEPTSQLDPIHAEEVLQAMRRVNEDWGITVLLSEHRVERCFHLADRIILFEAGRVTFQGTPEAFAAMAMSEQLDWQHFLPPITRHFANARLLPAAGEAESGIGSTLPLTVKAARSLLAQGDPDTRKPPVRQQATADHSGEPLLELCSGRASYASDGQREVLRGIHYRIHQGDHIALFGENGAGKSTLAKVLAGALPLLSGELRWEREVVTERFWDDSWKRIGYLSQNPNDYFLHDSVEAELDFSLQQAYADKAERAAKKMFLLQSLDLAAYRHRHPHDLSGGEKQRLALAIVLTAEPELLLLDEPTRGLDAVQKNALADLLHSLPVKAVVMITHDVEFAACYANRVSILSQGEIVADGLPDEVFSHSFYYMPQVYKLYRT